MEIAMLAERALDMLPQLDDPKECLKRAANCEQMAKHKKTGKAQGMFLELANRWREMALKHETKFDASKKRPAQPNASAEFERTRLGGPRGTGQRHI